MLKRMRLRNWQKAVILAMVLLCLSLMHPALIVLNLFLALVLIRSTTETHTETNKESNS